MQGVRTRFAPSPTGYMHIGGLRTALYAYLLAKSKGGSFILRIEDTDQKRFVEGAAEIIYSSLKTAGLLYDEGPDIGGAYAPYIQSERKNLYIKYAQELVQKGAAYYCFCTDTQHSAGAAVNEKYDRRCRALPKEKIEQKIANGEKYVIRQFIQEGSTSFTDHVYGSITVDNSELDDQVLIKSDLMPTYNFANVIDDYLMKITHVIRGSEFLSSTPKHVLLYEALGFPIPEYIHLPLVLNENGEKLSKRMGHASFDDLIDKGYLPCAIVNYIALLGFTPGDNREVLTLKELTECFNIKGISKSPARFDIAKLTWMNGEYFKLMDNEAFYVMAKPFIEKTVKTPGIDAKNLAKIVKSRVSFLSDISEMLDFIDEMPSYDIALYNHKKMKTDAVISLKALIEVSDKLKGYGGKWENSELYAFLCELASNMELKNGQVLWPVRTALSGKPATPCGASELMELLGKNETMRRIGDGIKLLKTQ